MKKTALALASALLLLAACDSSSTDTAANCWFGHRLRLQAAALAKAVLAPSVPLG